MKKILVSSVSVLGLFSLLAMTSPALADTVGPIDFESPYTLGNINGQDGWMKTGTYDVEVDTVASFANAAGFGFDVQALRVSNAVTSGSFGDQTFSPGLTSPANESGPTTHFESSFEIGSTQATQQSGLFLSVSPDDGTGGRMSYVGFDDQADGIHVIFYDVTDTGPLPTVASFNATDVATIDRTNEHTIKFVIDLVPGPANDVVELYVDGVLEITGTTWEDYYRYDPEQTGNGNLVPSISKMLFRVGGTAAPSTSGNGYLIDNFSQLSSTPTTPPSTVDLLSVLTNDFVILSKTGITDIPSSVITGNIGASPITGATIEPSCTEVSGTVYDNDGFYTGGFDANVACKLTDAGLLTTAVGDMETAYTAAAGVAADTTELGAGNIGGQVIVPGVYKWSTGVTIPTNVTLSGGASDVWIFQIAGNLDVASGGSVPAGVKVILTGGALASNVFWQVAGDTTLGTYSTFNGTILDQTLIAMQTGAVMCGRALAQTAVTLDHNIVSSDCDSFPLPPVNPTVTVTINKFIDGLQATGLNANNSAFPMSATWNAVNIGAGSGSYDLDADGFNGDPTPYQAITSEMTAGADYTTSEVTGGSVVGASCTEGKPFALVGYSSGDTLADAITAGASATVPNLTNLTQDAFVIVWNEDCATPALPTGEINGSKFWDVNANGIWDTGETGLGGWTINLAGTASDSEVTNGTGDYGFTGLGAGSYTLSETPQAGWNQTVAPGPITLGVDEVLNDQNFGNSCFVSTEGKSKGYWTNKNGEATMDDSGGMTTEFALLGTYSLVNEAGTLQGDFGNSYSTFKTWIGKDSRAKNMAYMLSVQLAAVVLSVEAGETDGSATVLATSPLLASVPGMSPLGVISISDLMTAANTALGADDITLAGDVNRAYQEALKNALDSVANGQNIQICDVEPNEIIN